MRESTRNALALFTFGFFMFSISPIFTILIDYKELSSILPSFFSHFLNVQELRWGSVGIGFIAIILGLLTVLINWKLKTNDKSESYH